MALPKIMLVTKDKNFAKSAKGALGGAVVLSLTDSGEKALKALGGKHDYSVVIADMVLAGRDGRAFLAAVRKNHPKIRRIAVTATPDFEQAMQLVNSAAISWLLPKPCKAEELRKAVTDAIGRHRREKVENESMKGTLVGGVKMLVDIMKMTHPEAVTRSKRIRARAQQINRNLKALSPQFMDMVIMLANVGCVGLPRTLLRKMETGAGITKQDMQTFRTHPGIANRLLENVPRMAKMAEILHLQNTPCSQNPPMGARILKVCQDMDQMLLNGASQEKALLHMRKRPEVYDPAVVEALSRSGLAASAPQGAGIPVADLKPGMTMTQDMVTKDGTVLLHKGECLSEASHIRLTTFNDLIQVEEPVYVQDTGACSDPAFDK
ncbi:HD domain-containing phosphohydrolase [Pseudodesulfovibrio portus]|uniref:Response regulatory domain-containing protein n=1 Tax=Pseudodesulfovibrio portus TaxID=231439 RepID=A0ABM8AP86_9BACT|nr:HD domain-containing phosphohydrolase [Pseudodesulfovibrio portus]BDQ33184.1 hypothetical protein JCM14722_07260 [Pseudodesulfovibrio portus]